MSETGVYLTVEQAAVCEKIAGENSLNGQRAKALLALDNGATHSDAATESGLTRGQVNYILRKFKVQGLAVFPTDVLPAPDTEPESEPEPVVEETIPVLTTPEPTVEATAVETGGIIDSAAPKSEKSGTKGKKSKKEKKMKDMKKGKKKDKTKKGKTEKPKKKVKVKGKNKEKNKKKKKKNTKKSRSGGKKKKSGKKKK